MVKWAGKSEFFTPKSDSAMIPFNPFSLVSPQVSLAQPDDSVNAHNCHMAQKKDEQRCDPIFLSSSIDYSAKTSQHGQTPN
jgi:hypothetical protein